VTQPEELTPAPYRELRRDFADRAVRRAEVPVEHAVSLPVPTLRWSVASFAGFAGPALRVPRQPLRLAPPDRWWAIDARSCRLVAYGLTSALPFGASGGSELVVADRSGRSVADVEDDLRRLDELMDRAAGPFLNGAAGDPLARRDLVEVFALNVTDAVLPWYRALAPDFFGWLAGEPR
jgi:hypothetical protein